MSFYQDITSENINNVLNKYEFKSTDKKPFVYQDSRQMLLRNFISKNTIYDNILLYHSVGRGKCHSKDTPILMFDGTVKKVQDIQEGDLLMGDNSTPRKVLSLARGTDNMYDIIPVKGDKYTVNEEHILCLKASGFPRFQDCKHNKISSFNIQWVDKNNFQSKTFRYNQNNKKEKHDEAINFFKNITNQQIIEISVKDYLALSKNKKNILKGYRTGVDFEEKDLTIDPYMIGYWLGDGTSRDSVITTQDSTVIHYFMKNLQKYDLYLSKRSSDYMYGITGSGSIGGNKFLTTLKENNLLNNKHIPYIYKCNSRENRLKLLAGILDADGSYYDGRFELTQSLEHEELMDDVIYLARSLGFACYKNKKRTSCTYKGVKKQGYALRINISGEGIENIPTLIPRKKANPRRQIKNVLVTGIKVKFVKRDEYYGFTLNDNCRYVMGDFTVTHNTCTSISIAEGFKEYLNNMGRRILVLVKNDNIKKNFANELLTDCAKNAYLDDNIKREFESPNTTLERKQELQHKLIRKINKMYEFMTYGTFVNKVLGMKEFKKDTMGMSTKHQERTESGVGVRKKTSLNSLNNTVIIIDEVHNVTNNDIYIALEKILKNSYNYRLVLLTATPMYDNPKEIVEITNLLNMNSKDKLLPVRNNLFKEFDGDYIMTKSNTNNLGLIKGNTVEITEYGKNLLKKRLIGKVSYYASNTETFPRKDDMGTSLTDATGSINIIECKMSEYQTDVYNLALSVDTKTYGNFDISELANNLESGPIGETNINSSSLYHNSSGASTFAYPNMEYGKDGFLSCFQSIGKNKIGKDLYRIKPEYKHILTTNLSKHSSKLESLLQNLKRLENKPGNIFIYSNYVEYNGTELIKQLLINNGYSEFQGKNQSQNNLGKCFIMYDSSYSSETREKLRKIFNSKDNKDGKFIKIVIGSPIISEGITLKNTRQVHILEPSWNMSRINQIIGRAVRNNSHKDLDQIDRNVEIFKYCSIPIKLQSIDKQKYLLSEYKDRANKKVERLLKQVALDCYINTNDPNLKPGSADCDYTNCNYKCIGQGPSDMKNLDKSTYNMYLDFFEKYDIEYITNVIKNLFSKYFVWNIEDIIVKIKEILPNPDIISNESIYTALSNLIDNKTIISDMYERDGFLIQKDAYIIFNPIDKDINSSIFSKTLDFEVNVNKYDLAEYTKLKYKKNLETKVDVKEKKEKTKKVSVELSDYDLKYNRNIMSNNLIYGHFRDKGIDGNFGPIDGKFRIVDLRKAKKSDAEEDKRKVITGMAITSKKKDQLLDIIGYLKITPKMIKEHTYISYNGLVELEKLNITQLAQIIQKHLEKQKLVLK
jgi:superfamily II DNA or RNA helicase